MTNTLFVAAGESEDTLQIFSVIKSVSNHHLECNINFLKFMYIIIAVKYSDNVVKFKVPQNCGYEHSNHF